MHARSTTLLALFATVLLGVAACGGGGNGGGDDTGTEEDTFDGILPDTCCTSNDTGTDTGPADTGTEDTRTPDPDTFEPEDTTGSTDTGMDTSGGDDTGMATDTGTDAASDTGADTATDTGDADATDTGDTDADADATDTAVDTDADGSAMDGGDVSPDATVSEMSIRTIRSQAQSANLQPGDSLSGTYYTSGAVVTGVQTSTQSGTTSIDGVFLQEPSGSPENSGIWVYFGNKQSGVSVPSLKVGSKVGVKGQVTNYDNNGGSTMGGLLEIHKVSEVTLVQQGASVPSPVQVSNASTLAPGGSNAEKYESVLVEVSNVSVDMKPNNFGETLLDSGLRIGSTLYDYTQDYSPTSGTTYSSVVGPLNYAYDKTMVAPRTKSDITK